MEEEKKPGGKDASASPAEVKGGKTDVSPASAVDEGKTDKPPREESIPRERFDQILASNKEMQERLDAVEKRSEKSDSASSWDKVSDRDLDYIITHPTEYPEHAQVALSERDKRLEDRITTKVMTHAGVSEFQSTNKDAFDPTTAIGKEVARIMSSKNQKEMLQDIVELANYRIKGGNTASAARKEVIDNMRRATSSAPGTETPTTTPPISFMDMSKDEFETEVQKVKLRELNKGGR